MSLKKEVLIELKDSYSISKDTAFKSRVVKDGNGAKVLAFKKFIGKKCVVIIDEE